MQAGGDQRIEGGNVRTCSNGRNPACDPLAERRGCTASDVQQGRAERIDVAGRPDLNLVVEIFWGGIAERKSIRSRPKVLGVREGGDTKVAQLDSPVGVEQQVLRLDVAMHDSLLVRRGQRSGRVASDPNRFGDRQRRIARSHRVGY